MNEDKRDYEIAFLLDSAEAEKELADVLRGYSAEFLNQKAATETRLAYAIKKHSSAFFGFYHFRMNPENIKPIKETLILNPKVLRYLIITPPIKITASQPGVRPEKRAAPQALSNEALEEKLEEILK